MKPLPVVRRRFLLMLLLWPLASIAQDSGDAGFEAALTHFNRARQGDGGQLELAVEAFRRAPANPALQPIYLAYLGSAQALQARAAWMPWTKLRLGEQGLDHIDQGLAALRPEHDRVVVQGAPLGLATRMVAAATFVAMPDGIFHRRVAAKSLLAEIRRNPLLASASAGFRAELDTIEAQAKEAGK